MSNGTLQQLASKGVQDGHLSIAPETSFFKRTYKRPSNYAIELIDQQIIGADFGRQGIAQVTRNGDLLNDIWLIVNLYRLQLNAPAGDTVHWTNSLGHAMIKKAAIAIGTTDIDEIPGEFMEIRHEFESDVNVNVDELVLRSESQAQLIDWANNGNTLDSDGNPITQLWVKMDFWFSRATSQSLPMIALQYHDIKVKIDFRLKSELMVFSNDSNTTLSTSTSPVLNGSIASATMAGHYVFLDSAERRLFAANAHEYLIKNVQTGDSFTKRSGETRLSCNVIFNHPVTALFWAVRKATHVQHNDFFNFERTDGFGDDTITTATLKFNGSARESIRGPLYWRQVQASKYWPRTPRKNIYAMSFSQFPTAWYPSGSVNLSRIDTTSLDLQFPGTDALGNPFTEATVLVYAENFNVLRLQAGMAAKKYAN